MNESVPLPSYVQIEPVGQCNLSCQMCAIQFRQDGPPYGPPAFMDFDLFKRLVDEFQPLKALHLQGLGEPMMHPRFFEMIRYAVGLGTRVTTNTNLTLVSRKRAEALVTSGLEEIHISIDGANAETYERIRNKGRYDKVMEGLQFLKEAKEKLDSPTPHLQLVMVIMRQNLPELPELVRQAHGWGMEEIFVQHLSHDFTESDLPEKYIPMRDFVEEQTLLHEDIEQVEHHFGLARQAAQESGIKLRLPKPRIKEYPPGTPGRKRCDWPWSGAYFSYDGQAMPCCMVSTPDRINFGSAAGQPVKELWNGEAYQQFRSELASETPPEICQACSIYKGTF